MNDFAPLLRELEESRDKICFLCACVIRVLLLAVFRTLNAWHELGTEWHRLLEREARFQRRLREAQRHENAARLHRQRAEAWRLRFSPAETGTCERRGKDNQGQSPTRTQEPTEATGQVPALTISETTGSLL